MLTFGEDMNLLCWTNDRVGKLDGLRTSTSAHIRGASGGVGASKGDLERIHFMFLTQSLDPLLTNTHAEFALNCFKNFNEEMFPPKIFLPKREKDASFY